MTDFDPNWPHGHVTRDGRKAANCVFCGKSLTEEPCLNCQFPPGSKRNPYPWTEGDGMEGKDG